MRINPASSDTEVLLETGERLKRLRIASLMTQTDLAEATGVSLKTIKNMEAGKEVSFSTVIRVLRALKMLQNLDNAIPEPSISPNEVIRLGKQRQRVRKTVREPAAWKWGDEQ
ncbi:MAG: helix-turn-helix transcriptional regulator [Spirochaetales bacterium]|nr:helix-turn-helix transcriptional regulator [Spirochaetales bacterium]MBR0520398.1 helix-turn-helix transcriptional regulator [Spirochaetales bacterium]